VRTLACKKPSEEPSYEADEGIEDDARNEHPKERKSDPKRDGEWMSFEEL
jgi:hypothetical protein